MNYSIAQKAIITNKENHILLLKRSQKASNTEYWSFPGGALENDEDPYEGIAREVLEETQISMNNLRIFHVFTAKNTKGMRRLVIGYTGKIQSESVILNEEHSDFIWAEPNEASKLILTPDASNLLTAFTTL